MFYILPTFDTLGPTPVPSKEKVEFLSVAQEALADLSAQLLALDGNIKSDIEAMCHFRERINPFLPTAHADATALSRACHDALVLSERYRGNTTVLLITKGAYMRALESHLVMLDVALQQAIYSQP